MKNSHSNIFAFNNKILKKTTKNLIIGNVAALPTETVYGLAGNAYLKGAVQNIFKLKGRPKSNPLIIHYYNFQKAKEDVVINENFKKLYKKFCPGPITFILKKSKKSKVHPIACANLNSIAVRFPKHKTIRSILKKTNFPLAMPSANKSSNVSPVNSIDVLEEFNNKIKIIIDGGKSKIGIESTIVDLTSTPTILRPGIISKNMIEKTLKIKVKSKKKLNKIKSPGMMKKHYSPGMPVMINQKKPDGKSAFVYIGNRYKGKKNFFSLSKNFNLEVAASNLYRTFRIIKRKGYKKIQISKIPLIGCGIAINDRIKRASKY